MNAELAELFGSWTVDSLTDEEGADLSDDIADDVDFVMHLLQKIDHPRFLQATWSEIVGLQLEHRRALLLRLERGQILPFVRHACRSLGKVAEVLEMPLPAFLEFWRQWPPSDNAIAVWLSKTEAPVTRNQVIGFRSSARRLLYRHWKKNGW